MVTMEQLIAAGTALARSIGHMQGCPKISPLVPCTCGCAGAQAKTLDDWQHLTADYILNDMPVAAISADIEPKELIIP